MFIPDGEVLFRALARTPSRRSLFDPLAIMWFWMYGSSAQQKVVFGFFKGGQVWR